MHSEVRSWRMLPQVEHSPIALTIYRNLSSSKGITVALQDSEGGPCSANFNDSGYIK